MIRWVGDKQNDYLIACVDFRDAELNCTTLNI